MPIPQTASICLLHVGAYNISHFHKRAALFFPSSLFPDLPFLRCRYQFHAIHHLKIPHINHRTAKLGSPPHFHFHFPLSHLSTSSHLPNPNLSLTTPSHIHSPHPQDIPKKKPIKFKIPLPKKEKPPKNSKKCHQKISTSSPATPTNSPKSKRFCRRLPYNSHRRMWIW